MRFSSADIAMATNGSVAGPDTIVDGASQDSRAIRSGQLFVPLVAERDGHDFIDGALGRGAGAYLSHDGARGGTAILVDDTTTALDDLARVARGRIDAPVIGITGSVGKTSTKDLLSGALRATLVTHASEKSFNNEIGVPLTLLNAPDSVEACVIEMGSRGLGHIAMLCEVAKPDIGIVTTVAGAHTGEFGSLENIAIAKGELVEALPPTGLAVLNADNPLVASMVSRTNADVMTFGMGSDASVRVRSVSLDDELRATFLIDTEWGPVTAQPSTRGAHMATNVAAAVGVALHLGVGIEDIEGGLRSSDVSPWRMEVSRTSAGGLVINDSYNANPTSMRGAIDSLARLSHARKIAILGYMAELGPGEAQDHLEIAAEVRSAGIELIAVGTDLYGEPPSNDPLSQLGHVDENTAVLVKGSRSAGLETLAHALVAD